MDKYTFLFLVNLPFVLFGLAKSFSSYKAGVVKRLGLSVRLIFWVIILLGLLFSQEIYEFLIRRQLTDSAPISLADVLEITGIIFSLFLILRLYSKHEQTERRFTELQQELAILLADKHPKI